MLKKLVAPLLVAEPVAARPPVHGGSRAPPLQQPEAGCKSHRCEWIGGWGCRYPDMASGAVLDDGDAHAEGSADNGEAGGFFATSKKHALVLGGVIVLALVLMVGAAVAMVRPDCGGGSKKVRGKGGVQTVTNRAFEIEALMSEEFEDAPFE